MYNDINFLSGQQKRLKSRDQSDKKSFIFIAIFSLIMMLLFGGLWFINVSYKEKIAAITNDKTTLEQEILRNVNQEKDYLVFHEKIKKLAELIEKRSSGTDSLVETYLYFTTQNTAVMSSTYDYYTKNLELLLASNDVFSLPQLLSLIQSKDFVKKFANVEILSLSRTLSGIYQLKVNLEL